MRWLLFEVAGLIDDILDGVHVTQLVLGFGWLPDHPTERLRYLVECMR